MERKDPSQAMALFPQTKWTRKNRHDKKPNRSSGTQCVKSAKLGSPREILSCSSRVSSEIHMAYGNKESKLFNMARADILKCSKILSTISGNSQRPYGAILTRSAIHQKGKAQESRNKKCQWKNHNRKIIWRGRTATSHPNKRTPYLGSPHQQTLHWWLWEIPN